MAKKKEQTTNTTLLRLKNTPFKTASELKQHEERILREEWENVERARQRRILLQKDENKEVIGPFLKGFKAKFVGSGDNSDNLVRVYLASDESIQIDIDDELKSKDVNGAVESLVKSLTESFVNGYLTALGLKDESLFHATKKAMK
tara:strand:- start:41478 stop:41915 length:438 start_codon:yes stop_codon:yes gene_type:complete